MPTAQSAFFTAGTLPGTVSIELNSLSRSAVHLAVHLAVDAFHCNLEAIEAVRLWHLLHHHHILLVLQVQSAGNILNAGRTILSLASNWQLTSTDNRLKSQ